MLLETITGVGIIVDGKLYSLPKPNRHHHLFNIAFQDKGSDTTIVPESQGFITSLGRYVSREEALTLAKRANQLFDRHLHATQLFSESVW